MNMNLGNTIKSVRKKRGYKQSELSNRANISVSHLCLIEKNKRDPSLSTIEAISTALNVPVSVLVFLATQKEQVSEIPDGQIEHLARSMLELMDDSTRQKSLF